MTNIMFRQSLTQKIEKMKEKHVTKDGACFSKEHGGRLILYCEKGGLLQVPFERAFPGCYG